MRKFLIALSFILLVSCSPLANFEIYDIYSNYAYVYDEDIMIEDSFPPQMLEKGEGFVMYMGESARTMHRNRVTIIFVRQYIFPIKNKVKVPNGSKIYVEVINDGEPHYSRYVIVNGKKYMMDNEMAEE